MNYKARRNIFMKSPIKRSHNLLTDALTEALIHKDKSAEANALVHLLREVVISTPCHEFRAYLRKFSKLCPSNADLERLGKVPDVKIRAFKTAFTRVEWELISVSPAIELEDTLKILASKRLEPDDVISRLARYDEIRNTITQDRIINTILEVKRSRIQTASRWKRNNRDVKILEIFKEIPKHLDEERVHSTFSPSTILTAFQVDRAEELDRLILYDGTARTYYWDTTSNIDLGSATYRGATEFIGYLNT